MKLNKHKLTKYIFIFFIVLTTNIINAQDRGWRLVDDAINNYENSNFDEAISKLNKAFTDPTLSSRESLVGYSYLAASYLQLGNVRYGRDYIKKILIRNSEEQIPDVLAEFQDDWDNALQNIFCKIIIKSNPQNATININGNNEGVTDKEFKLIKDSLYTIEISVSGYNSITITQRFYRDSTLNITLTQSQPISKQPNPIFEPKTSINLRPALPYIFGVVSSAGLWGTFLKTSIHFYNKKRENIQSLTMARTETAHNNAENSIRQNDFWGQFFYYGSYVLIASGIGVGIITKKAVDKYEYYNSFNDIKIYCAFDDKFTPSINIRRNIW